MNKFEVIVVGGGHAGCEAALAASRMGARTLLISLEKAKIGYTSCNPSIGGIGKGQLVKEIDALGGEMAKVADASCLQYRMLNMSKGYAARSSRMQIDRKIYNETMLRTVSQEKNLEILEDEVKEILVNDNKCIGVICNEEGEIRAKTVIITTGTFMNGKIHIGLDHTSGGRIDEKASIGLSENLAKLGLKVDSLKTGTPARLDGKTIDFDVLQKQCGDENIIPFSFSTPEVPLRQLPCYLTRTNAETHKIIMSGIDRSPLYTGKIKSTGVRYCPSIEDKLMRFPERETHVVYLEPEGLDTDLYYPNGISTSLPFDVQERMIHSIKGLEKTTIVKPAYGIEYDYVDPLQLYHTLETKIIDGLFIAGQINGTTGYEEAAALGLMAGINAACKSKNKKGLILDRSKAYIGVLIDDLVTKGTKEPYRMFTSRVEHRIILREDNADLRLSEIGNKFGLVKDSIIEKIQKKRERVDKRKKELAKIPASIGSPIDIILEKRGETRLAYKTTMLEVLKRSGIFYSDLEEVCDFDTKIDYYEKVQIEVDVKYASYIKREISKIKKFEDLEKISIPKEFTYNDIAGLSTEIKEKLEKVRPISLAQASRISGVTPVAITILMVKLRTANFSKK